MNMRNNIRVAIISVVLCAWAYIILAPMPRLPIGMANGSYANNCCGEMTLRDGKMSVGGRLVTYVIEVDKGGPYVLPNAYIDISGDHTLEVDTGKYPLIMRLDDPMRPTKLELMTEEAVLTFRRILIVPSKPQPTP